MYFDFKGFKTVELNKIYFSDKNSWFDPNRISFTRSIISFTNNFVEPSVILNNCQAHENNIAITFEFEDISTLIINGFTYDSEKALKGQDISQAGFPLFAQTSIGNQKFLTQVVKMSNINIKNFIFDQNTLVKL